MGAVTVDLWRLERIYDVKYPLDNPFGVRAVFEDYSALKQRALTQGDYDAHNVILDFADAIKGAKLTQKQKDALYYVFIEKMTQEEAAETMGIAQSKVSGRVDRAINRIAESQGYDEGVFRESYRHRYAI